MKDGKSIADCLSILHNHKNAVKIEKLSSSTARCDLSPEIIAFLDENGLQHRHVWRVKFGVRGAWHYGVNFEEAANAAISKEILLE